MEIALCSGGEIGKHAAFRALWAQALGSSSLPSSTSLINLKTQGAKVDFLTFDF